MTFILKERKVKQIMYHFNKNYQLDHEDIYQITTLTTFIHRNMCTSVCVHTCAHTVTCTC